MILTDNYMRQRPRGGDEQAGFLFSRQGREALGAANTWFDVYPGTTPDRAFPSTVAPVTIESNAAANNASGTGAQVVSVVVLDGDHKPTEVIAPLSGLTPVAIGSWLEVLAIRVMRAGSYGAVQGGYVRAVHGDAGEISYIREDRTHDGGCHMVQPAGSMMNLIRWHVHIDVPNQNDVAHGQLQIQPPGEPWHSIEEIVVTQDFPSDTQIVGIGATARPGTKFRARAECSRSGAQVDASLHFSITLGARPPRIEL